MESRSRYWITFGLLAFLSGMLVLYLSLHSPIHSAKSVIQFAVKSGQRGPDGIITILTYKLPVKLRPDSSPAENSTLHMQLLLELSKATRQNATVSASPVESAKATFSCNDFETKLSGPDIEVDPQDPSLTTQDNGDCVYSWPARPHGTGVFEYTASVKHPLNPLKTKLDCKVTIRPAIVDQIQHGLGPVVTLLGILSTIKGLLSSKKDSREKRSTKKAAKA